MTYKNRKNIRLKNYDYGQDGLYFVTICINNKEHLLGKVFDNSHFVNDAGLMVKSIWNNLSKYYKGVQTHHFIVMPNHVHGIVELDNADIDLSELMQRFKTFTTYQYIDGVHNNKWKPFSKKLWQRNYHEHVIRSNVSFDKLQGYILNNPMQWRDDIFYGVE